MFEDFGKKLSNFGQHMMKKTGEVAEIASLSTKVMGKKKKVQDELQALGKAYYEAHKDEITEFELNITSINNLFTEIAELEEEIKTLKEKLPEDLKAECDFEDEAAEEAPAEETAEEEAPAEEAPAEETAEEEAPAEEAPAEEDPAEEATAEEGAAEETPAEEVPVEEAKPEE